MKYAITREPGRVILALSGHITVADMPDFETTFAEALGDGSRGVTVDLGELEYMDSSGLGFLISLRDKAERKSVDVALRGARGEVRELLELARFDTLFRFV